MIQKVKIKTSIISAIAAYGSHELIVVENGVLFHLSDLEQV